MENNMFEQARQMINNLTAKNGTADVSEQQATQKAINAAYQNATQEEKSHLQQLEQNLKSQGLLSDSPDQLS